MKLTSLELLKLNLKLEAALFHALSNGPHRAMAEITSP
jgi:hypothetical protein